MENKCKKCEPGDGRSCKNRSFYVCDCKCHISPKEEERCPNCNEKKTLHDMNSSLCAICSKPFPSPKVSEWEELKKLLDDSRTGLKDSSDTNKTRYAILELFSSTEKRLANEIIGEIEKYIPKACKDKEDILVSLSCNDIIKIIKSKYETNDTL